MGLGRFIPKTIIDAVSRTAAKTYLRLNPSQVITNGPFTWDEHGLAARTSSDFLRDPAFAKAHDQSWKEIEALNLVYQKREGAPVLPIRREGFRNEWNMHTACQVGRWALNLPRGDFVECGVGGGFFSRCVMRYLDFEKTGRTFFLIDRWSAETVDYLLTVSERKNSVSLYVDNIETAKVLFAPYPNAKLIQGVIPDCLDSIDVKEIAFLYLDLNSAEPEKLALEKLWPRVLPGGWIVSDDFGFVAHKPQRDMFTKFFADKGIPVFYCPTGQGIAQKPLA